MMLQVMLAALKVLTMKTSGDRKRGFVAADRQIQIESLSLTA
jgi:hypothetical protein